MKEKRIILATCALPYANGPIHIGHLMEYLYMDYWTRFLKMKGHKALYLCADDTHGTPIMIRARREGISPEELIAKMQKHHLHDFSSYEIEFDHYSSTNSEANKELCSSVFQKVEAGKHITEKSIAQFYCDHDKMFLPDRFVKGTCPKCSSAGQYGDNCDACGATYDPTEVTDAICTVCGNKPNVRDSRHLYFKLNDFRDFLQDYVPKHTAENISNKLKEWFKEDLRDWCISRDAPYFGFEIPGYPNKFFYVWVDAPLGYASTAREWCEKNGETFDKLWNDPKTEIYHLIGKDIIYFHSLFYPAMLHAAGIKTPNEIFVHGFITVNGEKMSKSKGTFIQVSTFRKHMDPTYYRYYIASKINASSDDIDFNFDDFVGRVNGELVGKITNIASRGAQMLTKRLDGKMGSIPENGKHLIKMAHEKADTIAAHYENRNFNKAMAEIRLIADEANKYFDDWAPWKLIKEDEERTRGILTTTLNVFRIMAVYLKPILPSYIAKVEAMFGDKPYVWDDAQTVIEGKQLEEYEHLIGRLDKQQIDKIVEETKAEVGETKENIAPIKGLSEHSGNGKALTLEEFISIDDFFKVKLKVGTIVSAESVEGSSKLLKFIVDLGDAGKRQIFSGIKGSYPDPADLVGKQTVVVANLKPRKMKFGVSEGMILAVGDGDDALHLLFPDGDVKPGSEVG